MAVSETLNWVINSEKALSWEKVSKVSIESKSSLQLQLESRWRDVMMEELVWFGLPWNPFWSKVKCSPIGTEEHENVVVRNHYEKKEYR